VTDLEKWNETSAKSFDSNELDKMVKDLHEIGKSYDALEAQKKKAGQEWEELQGKILKILQDAKKSQYSVDGIGMVYTKNKLVVTTPKSLEDKRAFKRYCLDKYGPEFVDDKFNMLSVSLTSFYNAEVEASKDPSFQIAGIQSPTQVTTLAFKGETK
jgi:ElaB/YqjD/DUF883 family membrane-anchored ribosome-binding protein